MKSGFVTLVGRSNVGKSTLLNALTGMKLAIVSPKPQTTRFPIHGVLNNHRGQAVFVDTPGIFEKAPNRLTQILNERAREAVRDIDMIVYVADPTRPIGNEEHIILRLVAPIKKPKILAINKTDLRDPPYLEEYRALTNDFKATVEISALKNKNLRALLDAIFEYLPEGEPTYHESQITNLEINTWLAEVIRDKIFIQLGDDLPYQ
ncbi:GTPase Era, partial [Candidatus Uhrbacteria bacterium]|nr:GTPase Era [Candidatus Uhrbacteria bacterium]